MRQLPRVLPLFLILVLLIPMIATGASEVRESRMIVVFQEDATPMEKEGVGNAYGIQWMKDLKGANARVAYLSENRAAKLREDPAVKRVEPDILLTALGKPVIVGKPVKPAPAQSIPWGITKIRADQAWPLSAGSGIKVGIVDTGIDPTHPDLAANIAGGYNAINPRKSFADDNGHGTHVAGTVAALNNGIGVVGVAPQVRLYGIKVLGPSGSGYLSDIVEGLDWAADHGIQVVNMSLGTDSYSATFEEAVQRVSEKVILVAAAGNDGTDVDYPGAFANVIAVGATDSTDTAASWSSRGDEVDVSAPGVSVYSTLPGGKYGTYSGTSMATPHVTGVVALMLASGAATTCSEVMAVFSAPDRLVDLGAPAWDETYGYGRIDALSVLN